MEESTAKGESEMSDQGKANYEGYHASVPGSKPKPFEELPHLERLHWDAGACSVEAWLAECPVDEDTADPEPAKVIVVTEHSGRKRRFAASKFAMTEDGQLAIGEPVGGDPLGRIAPVAGLNAGRWADVAYEGAELLSDPAARKLGIALAALTEISGWDDADSVHRARQAIEDIADVDL